MSLQLSTASARGAAWHDLNPAVVYLTKRITCVSLCSSSSPKDSVRSHCIWSVLPPLNTNYSNRLYGRRTDLTTSTSDEDAFADERGRFTSLGYRLISH